MMLIITILFLLIISAHIINAFKLNLIKRTQWRHFSNILTVDDNNNQKWREDVLTILTDIIDPESGLGLVEAGFVNRLEISSDGVVKFDLKIEQQELAKLCSEKLAALAWVKSVDYVPEQTKKANIMSIETPQSVPKGMERVKRVIAVSSCKGGVGKSTVSVSLAYILKLAGAKVGILDADIYGPSLPTMTKPANTEVVFAANQIQPLEFEGVKLMSMGFINKGAAIMRGPMVNQILNQFVSLCDWGDLDYLIVDMPPGTGDIQLTLAQIMNISAAVIVTTPQRLSFVDVVKGIDLFDTVNVPCVAVVENMANYAAYSFPSTFYDSLAARVAGAAAAATALGGDAAAALPRVADLLREAVEGQKQPLRVFGEGHSHRLREMWGIENIFLLPLLEEVSACGDKGLPYVLANPKAEITSTITKLAMAVAKEIARLDRIGGGGNSASTMNFDAATNEVVLGDGTRVAAKALRTSCRCAVCVEELTGRQLLDVNAVPSDVRPLGMAKIGRYAMSVDWSDGHKSLFPFKQVAALVGQRPGS